MMASTQFLTRTLLCRVWLAIDRVSQWEFLSEQFPFTMSVPVDFTYWLAHYTDVEVLFLLYKEWHHGFDLVSKTCINGSTRYRQQKHYRDVTWNKGLYSRVSTKEF